MAKFSLTLLYVTIAFVLAASANADSLGPHRRDHVDLGRMLKKRIPALGSLPLQGQQPSSTSSDNILPTSISSVVTQATPGSSTSTGPSPIEQSPSPTNGGGSSSSSASGPSSSSSSSSSSPTSSPTTSPTLDTSSTGPQPSTASPSKSVVYLTTTGPNSSPTPTQSDTPQFSSALPHTAVTVLIVLAACVGASVIAWTIIRKWKFRPSSDFEGRMQPIDWQPGVTGGGGGGGEEDSGLAGHRRGLSRSSSFHSGSANSHAVDEQTRGGAAGGYGSTPLNPIPDHDFTAGPANLAPVGGYADLARGATPQPMMQEHHGFAPSVNHPAQYDQYGIPPHHGYSGY